MRTTINRSIQLIGMIMFTPIGPLVIANSQPLNNFYKTKWSDRNIKHLRVDSTDFNMKQLNESIKNRELKKRRNRNNPILWKKLIGELQNKSNKITWELMPSDYMPENYNITERNIFRRPRTFKEAKLYYNLVEPKEKDYYQTQYIGPSFPTANQLETDEFLMSVYSLSSLSGGSGGGTGNQNYASRLDFGLNNRIQLSGFYSVSDDPLYSRIKTNTTSTPNYWENFGASLKIALRQGSPLKASIYGSLESWNIRNGAPNIFNNSGDLFAKRSVIGSLSLPISLSATKKIQFHITPGISFMPSQLGDSKDGYGTFYGQNFFFGTGITWRPISKLTFLGSTIFPLGPGNNNFDSSLRFNRKTIYSLGLNWDISPSVGVEGLITNGFGATPATGILTIPSNNQAGYYAGLKYRPYALDSPQQNLTWREEALSKGGLTVNTALIPEQGTSQLWANLDSSGNIFGYFGYSLSNIMQLDMINIGSFEKISDRGNLRKGLVDRYANNKSLNTRVGSKFVFMSPLRGAPFWLSGRVSAGRNQDKESQQGYLFAELVSTFKAKERLSININPKIAWNGFSTPKGLGISAHIKLSDNYQIIPELNIVGGENGDTNSTLALRWLANEYTTLDFYVSTAAGLQDLGQLLSSEDPRIGIKFILTY